MIRKAEAGRIHWLRPAIAAAVLVLVAAVRVSEDAQAAAATACSWTIVPSAPTSGYPPILQDIAPSAQADAWAVGETLNDSGSETVATIEHWDGQAWTLAALPQLALGDTSLRGSVSLGPSDVWAVGRGLVQDRTRYRPLVLHWDGSAWSRVAVPASRRGSSTLDAVSASGPRNVWAVGQRSTRTSDRSFAERWDGHVWRIMPRPPGSQAWGVVAFSESAVWATVDTSSGPALARWNGSTWRVHAIGLRFAQLFGIDGTSSADVWAVGYRRTAVRTLQTLAVHWDGTSVAAVDTPTRPGGSLLQDLVVTGNDGAWAVGARGHGLSNPLIQRRTVAGWRGVRGPSAPSSLGAVAVVPGSRTVWAVGGDVIERWC